MGAWSHELGMETIAEEDDLVYKDVTIPECGA